MMETQTCAGLVSALEGRAAFYDVVAALYYKPLAQEQIDRIAEGGLAAFAGAGELMAEGLHDMERALSKRHSGTRQELAVDFTGAFAGTSSWKGRYATPYESVFTSEEGLLFQDSYHEVYRLYRQNSVRKSPGYDFPDDHLVYCFRHFWRGGPCARSRRTMRNARSNKCAFRSTCCTTISCRGSTTSRSWRCTW